jgi:hypothetical protein
MSRILRVIGTTNTKSGAVVDVVHVTTDQGEIRSYDFEMFRAEVMPYTVAEVRAWKEKKAGIVLLSHERKKREPGAPRAWEAWHWGVIEDMRKLMELRNWRHVPEGFRDTFGHVGACQLAAIFPASAVWHETQAWARIYLPSSYVQSELRGHASSLLNRAKRAATGEKVEWGGKQRSPIYTYRKETLIDLLQVTSSEMTDLGFLIDTGEKYRRKNEKRSKTGLDRDTWLKTVAEGTAKSEKPWEDLGMSRATWYRNGKLTT